MRIPLELFKALLNACFSLMKLLCRQRPSRVVFLSRQGNEPHLDFKMLMDELFRRDSRIECVCICCRSDKTLRSLLAYAAASARSMYYLATSSVAVLNSYWPCVSMLRQRESMTVIQIWHALGKIKQSGWQTLGRDMGHSSLIAREMEMHRGYDVVIGGSKAWNPFYCASFGISESIIENVGLPRLDFLQTQGGRVRERFFKAYPELAGKRIVLYAPTFRPGVREGAERLLALLSKEKCAVIFKRHPNQPVPAMEARYYLAPEFSTLELLLVCDVLVTDYSAVAVEAASVMLPTYYYVFDIDAYTSRNGLNVSPVKSMPSCTFREAGDVVRALGAPYPREELERYRERYVLPDADLGHSTERIADMVEEAMRR